MKKLQKISAAAFVSVNILAMAGCASGGTTAPAFPSSLQVQNVEQDVIAVQSSETVKVVPDMAEIRLGITSQGADAKTCQEKNNEELTKVIEFLKEFGIPEESIQTSNYGMNPSYDRSSGWEIVGYEMQTRLTVSDITIDQAGDLLSACVDAGINQIENVSYLSSQYDTCYQDALAKAIESATTKAQVIAQAGGRTLGAMVHVEEYSSYGEARYNGYASAKVDYAAGAVMEEDMAVEPGQISVEARVSVEFALN